MANKYNVAVQFDKGYGIYIDNVSLSFKLFNYYYIIAESLTIINMKNISFVNKIKTSRVKRNEYVYVEPEQDEAYR